MKKGLLSIAIMVLATSCGGGGKTSVPSVTERSDNDSLVSPGEVVPIVEEVQEDSCWIAEDVIPVTADESFADFFYNFTSDSVFQRARIVFPISYYKADKVVRISAEDWRFDPLFSDDLVYTVLFDRVEDMEMEKDTAVHSVQVDEIDLKHRIINRYYFERINNSWFLEAMNKMELPVTEGTKEDFYSFYYRFANDSVFQQERVLSPLPFVTVDPEDEFQILETTLDVGQWFSFRPPLVKNILTNIHYGQPEMARTHHKVVEFKELGNGFNNTLYFKRFNGLWKLVKFEDLSD